MNTTIINELFPAVNTLVKSAFNLGGRDMHSNFLDAWYREKSKFLFELFGDKLIYEKEVEINENEEQLETKVRRWRNDMLVNSSMIRPANVRNLCSVEELVGGKLTEDKWLTNEIVVKKGSKISKLVRYLVKPELFDEVMTSYSQVVNQKKIKGVLCLSIHPLDYLTMSYNHSDWESCLELFDGDYRGGIGAYLNSDVSVIAYLKSTKGDIEVEDTGVMVGDKKWRSVVTITPDWAHVNRHYPYVSSDIEDNVFAMIEELMKKQFITESLTAENQDCTFETGTAYNDTCCHDTKIRFFVDKYSFDNAKIGTSNICPSCGRKHNSEDSLVCYCSGCDEGKCYGADSPLPEFTNYMGTEVTKTQRKFYIGDKVQFKTVEEMYTEFGGHPDEPSVSRGWNMDMGYLVGKTFNITGFGERRDGIRSVEGCPEASGWIISEDMIKLVEVA